MKELFFWASAQTHQSPGTSLTSSWATWKDGSDPLPLVCAAKSTYDVPVGG